MKIYIRKQVKFPGRVWRCKYIGMSFNSVKEAKRSKEFVTFAKLWGNGVYEFLNSNGKVDFRYKVKGFEFRATANQYGECIRPSQNLKHNRVPECSDCFAKGWKLGYEKCVQDTISSMYGHERSKFQSLEMRGQPTIHYNMPAPDVVSDPPDIEPPPPIIEAPTFYAPAPKGVHFNLNRGE